MKKFDSNIMMMEMCMCSMCMLCSTIFSNALSITKTKTCF